MTTTYGMAITIDVTASEDDGKTSRQFSETKQTYSGLSYDSLLDIQAIQADATAKLHNLGQVRRGKPAGGGPGTKSGG